jgi:hypothetical protein
MGPEGPEKAEKCPERGTRKNSQERGPFLRKEGGTMRRIMRSPINEG